MHGLKQPMTSDTNACASTEASSEDCSLGSISMRFKASGATKCILAHSCIALPCRLALPRSQELKMNLVSDIDSNRDHLSGHFTAQCMLSFRMSSHHLWLLLQGDGKWNAALPSESAQALVNSTRQGCSLSAWAAVGADPRSSPADHHPAALHDGLVVCTC